MIIISPDDSEEWMAGGVGPGLFGRAAQEGHEPRRKSDSMGAREREKGDRERGRPSMSQNQAAQARYFERSFRG